jgi:outer membrane protein
MNKTLLAVALASTFATALPAQAQTKEGNWMVRLRAVNLGMENKATAGQGTVVTAAALPSDGIAANDKLIPEVDFSYFFTKNIAAELILTVPQKHDVNITKGVATERIGSFKHLPPTLLLQYHFMPDSTFRPYVGLGLNYTRISSVNLRSSNAAIGQLTLESSSTGAALQAGFDVKLDKNLFLNFDIKKIYIQTDVIQTNVGQKISTLKLDPLAIGVGLGWKF